MFLKQKKPCRFHAQLTILSQTIDRFPLSVLAGIAFAVFGYLMIDSDIRNFLGVMEERYIQKLMLTSGLAIVIFGGITILNETKIKGKISQLSAYLFALLFLVLYFFITPDILFGFNEKITAIRYALLLGGSLFFFYLTPYIFEKTKSGFWQFVSFVSLRLITTVFFSLVLYVGLILAVRSVDLLFLIDMDDDLYGQLWFLVVGLFSNIFFFSALPRDFNKLDKQNDYPKLLKVFAKYVLIPLVLVYFTILYIYLGKIIITQIWPDGMVSMPILIYSAVGLLAFASLYPLRENKEDKWIGQFLKAYFILLIPSVLMLFAALYKRIDQYGITEMRYLGMITGIWLLGITLYYLFSKQKQLKIFFISLLSMALLSACGPVSAFQISKLHQTALLKNTLVGNGILQNGKIQKVPEDKIVLQNSERPKENIEGKISLETQREISAGFDYLISTHGLDHIASWFEVDLSVFAFNEPYNYGRIDTTKVMAYLGLQYISHWDLLEVSDLSKPSRQLSLYVKEREGQFSYDIADYQYLIPIIYEDFQFFGYEYKTPGSFLFEIKIRTDQSGKYIDVKNSASGEIINFNIEEIIENLSKTYYSNSPVNSEKLEFYLSGNTVRAKLMLRNINANFEDLKIENIWLDGLLAVGE